ncbi:phosphoribosylglycinamide formyltransferase [Erwinia sp. CPCC 100877]|nr:phosphoribosylglycinamide formyltransferase [Erwinia sp. CPCC 100877]
MKLAIFASGSGSNFQAIAEAVQKQQLAAEIVLLFCDQKAAHVLQRAAALQIPAVAFSPKDFDSKEQYEAAILQLLEEKEVELIVLAGYMRIIGATLLSRFANRMINIHPSLLPSFPGTHGIQDAFEAGVAETGVTIHYVDAGVDTGPIIAQERVAITAEDTLATLTEKIHAIEHRLYPIVLQKLITTQKERAIHDEKKSLN